MVSDIHCLYPSMPLSLQLPPSNMSSVDVKEELSDQQMAAAEDEEEGWEDAEEDDQERADEEEGEDEEEEDEREENSEDSEEGEGEEDEEEAAGDEQAAADAAGTASPSVRCAMCGKGSEVASELGELLLFDCSRGKKRGAAHVHLGCAAWAPR